jgi:hypothetical protein
MMIPNPLYICRWCGTLGYRTGYTSSHYSWCDRTVSLDRDGHPFYYEDWNDDDDYGGDTDEDDSPYRCPECGEEDPEEICRLTEEQIKRIMLLDEDKRMEIAQFHYDHNTLPEWFIRNSKRSKVKRLGRLIGEPVH